MRSNFLVVYSQAWRVHYGEIEVVRGSRVIDSPHACDTPRCVYLLIAIVRAPSLLRPWDLLELLHILSAFSRYVVQGCWRGTDVEPGAVMDPGSRGGSSGSADSKLADRGVLGVCCQTM